jgi:hypothetical protein
MMEKTLMRLKIGAIGRQGALLGMAFIAVSFACKDEEPCDLDQELRGSACYPLPTPGAAGTGGTGNLGPADGGAEAVETDFGTSCTDTTASSDCGGIAPICAPFPSGNACTQILCEAGEANADVCPADWSCIRSGSNPSVCFGS